MRFVRFFAVAAGTAALVAGAAACEVFDPANADVRNADARDADARRVAARNSGAGASPAADPATPDPAAPTGPDVARVEVIPRAVAPGSVVTVQADCGPGGDSAVAKSDAFPAVTLAPSGGLLSAEARVARRTLDGTYRVFLTCANEARATTELVVMAAEPGQSTIGPHTGGGFLARDGAARGAAEAAGATEAGGATRETGAGEAGGRLASAPAAWVASGPTGWLAAGLVAVTAAAALVASWRRRPRRPR